MPTYGSRFVIGALLIALSLASATALNPAPANSAAGSRLNQPTDGYGMYDRCYVSEGSKCTGDRLTNLRKAGYSLILNYGLLGGTKEQVMAYLDAVKAAGLKEIVPIGGPYYFKGKGACSHWSSLCKSFGITSDTDFVTSVVNLVNDRTDLWGYYIADEPKPQYHTTIAKFAALVRRLDPSHPRLITVQYKPASDPHPWENLDELPVYADSADVLIQDWYPVGEDYLRPITETKMVAQGVERVVSPAGVASGMVLQAFSWGDISTTTCKPQPGCARYPTPSEQEEMCQDVLQNMKPRIILWYWYPGIISGGHPLPKVPC